MITRISDRRKSCPRTGTRLVDTVSLHSPYTPFFIGGSRRTHRQTVVFLGEFTPILDILLFTARLPKPRPSSVENHGL